MQYLIQPSQQPCKEDVMVPSVDEDTEVQTGRVTFLRSLSFYVEESGLDPRVCDMKPELLHDTELLPVTWVSCWAHGGHSALGRFPFLRFNLPLGQDFASLESSLTGVTGLQLQVKDRRRSEDGTRGRMTPVTSPPPLSCNPARGTSPSSPASLPTSNEFRALCSGDLNLDPVLC